MNQFKVTLVINTYSEDPEDWIVDAVGDQLEDDESLNSIDIERADPVWIGKTGFLTKDEAMYHCVRNGISPTLIHHEPS